MKSMKKIKYSKLILSEIKRLIPGNIQPGEVIHNIQQKMLNEEIRENYLKALPKLTKEDKLNLSLEDIINSLEIREELLKNQGSCGPGVPNDPEEEGAARAAIPRDRWDSFHPGRLSLFQACGAEPDATPLPINLIGGVITTDNIYFLGGMPLIPWGRKSEPGFTGCWNSMGMKICPPDIYQRSNTILEKYTWRSAKELLNKGGWGKPRRPQFELLSHLQGERTFWANRCPDWSYQRTDPRPHKTWDQGRPPPRTKYGGEAWIARHRGGKTKVCSREDGYNDPYVWYLQNYEDCEKEGEN